MRKDVLEKLKVALRQLSALDYKTLKKVAHVPLYCPNCHENLGKDVENPRDAFCGTCGTSFKNPRGYTDDDDDEE